MRTRVNSSAVGLAAGSGLKIIAWRLTVILIGRRSVLLRHLYVLLKLRCITLPLLKPVLVNVTVLNVTYGLRVFDMIYSLTNGGPGNATGVINTAVYKEFSKGNLAMGTTLSSVLFFVVLALLYFIIKSMENKEVGA